MIPSVVWSLEFVSSSTLNSRNEAKDESILALPFAGAESASDMKVFEALVEDAAKVWSVDQLVGKRMELIWCCSVACPLPFRPFSL